MDVESAGLAALAASRTRSSRRRGCPSVVRQHRRVVRRSATSAAGTLHPPGLRTGRGRRLEPRQWPRCDCRQRRPRLVGQPVGVGDARRPSDTGRLVRRVSARRDRPGPTAVDDLARACRRRPGRPRPRGRSHGRRRPPRRRNRVRAARYGRHTVRCLRRHHGRLPGPGRATGTACRPGRVSTRAATAGRDRRHAEVDKDRPTPSPGNSRRGSHRRRWLGVTPDRRPRVRHDRVERAVLAR